MEQIFRVAADGRDAGLAHLKRAHAAGETLQGWQVDRTVRDTIAARASATASSTAPATPSASTSTATAPTSTTWRPTTPARW